MSVSNDSKMKIEVHAEPSIQSVDHHAPETEGGAAKILRQWEREDLLKRGLLGLRGISMLFSFISFILMASNKHGEWREFHKYEEYRYLLAVAIITSLYSGYQVFRQFHELYTRKNLLYPRTTAWIDFDFVGDQTTAWIDFDFVGDQVVTYLLISSVSSAVPITNRFRDGADNIFTDKTAAAISLSFFAFLCLAISALISGYKLSAQTYI